MRKSLKRLNNLGLSAEKYASNLLSIKGYKIIEHNFHSRFGEIDIIAVKDGKLIFIEVKARSSDKFGLPVEAVTPQKIWKIGRTGEYYSILHPNLPKSLRIEVVSLIFEAGILKESQIIAVD